MMLYVHWWINFLSDSVEPIHWALFFYLFCWVCWPLSCLVWRPSHWFYKGQFWPGVGQRVVEIAAPCDGFSQKLWTNLSLADPLGHDHITSTWTINNDNVQTFSNCLADINGMMGDGTHPFPFLLQWVFVGRLDLAPTHGLNAKPHISSRPIL